MSLLFILREWNSYTPAIPAQEESDRGGGYFIWHNGHGIVIDPGYDFIENFHHAGGRLCDIHHIVVTHAHDDHTAELEPLLMLLHRRSKSESDFRPVNLYLSQGVERKFSGFLPLRGSKHIGTVTTLANPHRGGSQSLQVHDHIKLTVLPAYHDDVLTSDTAVGLLLTITANDEKKRILFTSDSGLYPLALDSKGNKTYYDSARTKPRLDTSQDRALYCAYPDQAKKPDLLIAHIGSIKESEFKPYANVSGEQAIPEASSHEGQWYYVDHLGLLGTLILIDKLDPGAAIISEFGSELKDIRLDLVNGLEEALHDRQSKLDPAKKTPIIPGDVTIVYDISTSEFLSHDQCEFHKISDLKSMETNRLTINNRSGLVELLSSNQTKHIHLLANPNSSETEHDRVSKYYKDLHKKRLPYFAQPTP